MIEARGEREIVLRLADGENLLERLLSVSVESAAIVGGIGMVRAARLGYWNGTAYEEHAVADPVELLSLQGNLGRLDGEPIAHCHAVVARRNGTVTGGHLIAATVANTAEVILAPLQRIRLLRRREASGLAGLHLLGEDG